MHHHMSQTLHAFFIISLASALIRSIQHRPVLKPKCGYTQHASPYEPTSPTQFLHFNIVFFPFPFFLLFLIMGHGNFASVEMLVGYSHAADSRVCRAPRAVAC
jgi:hypothetical protein